MATYNFDCDADNKTASYRVFETLKLLMKTSCSTSEIAQFLEDFNSDGKRYTSAAIHKYLNTLKLAGIKIQKTGSKYSVKSLPFILNLSHNDLYAIALLRKAVNETHQNDLIDITQEITQQLKIRLKPESIIEYGKIYDSFAFNGLGFSQETIASMEKLKRFILNKSKLKITYLKNKENIVTICAPSTIKQTNANVYFSVLDLKSYCYIDIPLENIVETVELPANVSTCNITPMSTIFKLKGKLARNYELRNGEVLHSKLEDENIVVISRFEDKDLLQSRLLRYGELCEIISPKMHKESIKNTIESALANYGIK